MDRGPVVPLGGENWSHAEGELIRQAFGSLPRAQHRRYACAQAWASLLTDGPNSREPTACGYAEPSPIGREVWSPQSLTRRR